MKNVLFVLETAMWTFIALLLLLFVLGYLIINVPLWLAQHPQFPMSWQWYIIWGAMGLIALLLGLLWGWGGRARKDREEARRIADSCDD
jgi:type VI protein secretion system component VasK